MKIIRDDLRRQWRYAIPIVIVAALGAWISIAEATHCVAGGSCTENVVGTKHNLVANTDTLLSTAGPTGVCEFCHTPHGATVVGSSEAPLWNRAVPTNTGYSMYNSPNTDVAPGAGPLGVSLACLSCHDGTISLDALVNAPGSGGFQAGNRGTLASGGSIGLTFTGPGVEAGPNNSLKEGNRPNGAGGFLGGLNDFVSPTGAQGMSPFPNLERDLRDDHPISIRMPATDPQFDEALASGITGNLRPIVRAGRALPADKRDMVRLYDTAGITGVNKDAVECASCHNPHTPRTTFLRLPSIAGGAGNGTLNTVSSRDFNHEPNQGSLVCITCHQK